MSSEGTLANAGDKELFEHAIEDVTPTEPTEDTETKAEEGQPRDAQGRFASREAETAEAAPAEPVVGAKPEPDHRVPLRELLDEREKRQAIQQRYEAETRALQQQFAHLQQQMRPSQQIDPNTIFENPDQYLAHHLNPLRQQLAQAFAQQQQQAALEREGMSRELAEIKYGEEAVNAAYAAIESQMKSGQALHDYARIMRSRNPWGELVKWHKDAQNRQLVGDDPKAFVRNQILEMAKDPKQQAELMELLRGNVSQSSAKTPNVQLPPSLNKIAAAQSRVDDDGDMSDASLFRQATR